MKRSTTFWFYILSIYVIVQFVWWGVLINKMHHQIYGHDVAVRKTFMIIGECTVFLLILFIGIIRIRKSFKRELSFSRNQNNFLLSVTHELKTPLASSRLYLQTLQKHKLPEEKQLDIIEKALQQNDQLEKLINNILNASRLENRKLQLNMEEVNVSKYLNNIIDRYIRQYPLYTFNVNVAPDVTYQIDPFIVETVVNNIIENAIKYSSENPVIEVELERQSNLTLRVKDNGIGIPAEQRKNIFKKFYRVGNEETRTQKGSGLGLFIVNEFLRLHNGSIKYLPNKPKGSIFEITI